MFNSTLRSDPAKTRAWQKRSQAKVNAKARLTPGTPIKKVSDRRKEDDKLYKIIRKEYLLAHPVCEFCSDERSSDIHHKRGRLGPLLTDTRYFMAVGRLCHGAIEREREAGYINGNLLSRHTSDAKNPTYA